MAMHPILLCLMLDDFTCQVESAATQWNNKQKCRQNRFCLPISRLFGCSVIGVALKLGGVKTIIGIKTDLVLLYKHCTPDSYSVINYDLYTGVCTTEYHGTTEYQSYLFLI